MPSASSTSSTRRRIAAGAIPRFSSTKATSCSTWSTTNWASGSWATKPTTSASSRGWCVRVDRPNTTTSPAKRPPVAWGTSPFARAQQRALARARRADDEQHLARLDLEVDAGERGVGASGYAKRHVPDGDRAHDVHPGGSSERPATSERQQRERRAATCSDGPAQRRLASQREAVVAADRADGERAPARASTAPTTSQSASASAARPVPRRARVPADASTTAPTSADARRRARAPPRASRRRPTRATNAPPSASSDADARTSRRPGRAAPRRSRAKPRASIDSARVTARSMPLSSTGTIWRSSRPRRTTRPPVRARSASRTSPIAARVDGTKASADGHDQPELVEGAGRDCTSSWCDDDAR